MKVSELINGDLYHFPAQIFHVLVCAYWDSGTKMRESRSILAHRYSATRMISAGMLVEHVSNTTGPAVYLGSIDITINAGQLQGLQTPSFVDRRKYHSFLIRGKKEYVSGRDIKYFRRV